MTPLAPDRQAALAAALRANLKRRKAAGRVSAEPASGGEVVETQTSGPPSGTKPPAD